MILKSNKAVILLLVLVFFPSTSLHKTRIQLMSIKTEPEATEPQTVSSNIAKPTSLPASSSSSMISSSSPEKNHQPQTSKLTKKQQREKMVKLHLNSTEKVFTHFFSHLPKSGSTYAFKALLELVNKEFRGSPKNRRFRPCNMRLEPAENFTRMYRAKEQGVKCTLWMSERPAKLNRAQHNYVILRDPLSHTVSNYFHCTESGGHRNRAHLMPSLDHWLTAWVDALDNQTKAQENHKFRCYNPMNFESSFTGFKSSASLAENKQMLLQKFDVLGDNAQMDKTVCMIFARYAGWVPDPCDCTDQRRRRLGGKVSHGVKHHGNTFNLTDYQRDMIVKLRTQDTLLYELGKEIFAEQVAEVENTFRVRLCDKYTKN